MEPTNRRIRRRIHFLSLRTQSAQWNWTCLQRRSACRRVFKLPVDDFDCDRHAVRRRPSDVYKDARRRVPGGHRIDNRVAVVSLDGGQCTQVACIACSLVALRANRVCGTRRNRTGNHVRRVLDLAGGVFTFEVEVKWWVSSILAAVLSLTRVDAGLVLPVVTAMLLFKEGFQPPSWNEKLRNALRWVSIPAALLLAQLAFRFVYYEPPRNQWTPKKAASLQKEVHHCKENDTPLSSKLRRSNALNTAESALRPRSLKRSASRPVSCTIGATSTVRRRELPTVATSPSKRKTFDCAVRSVSYAVTETPC